jgi:hypothetical protein
MATKSIILLIEFLFLVHHMSAQDMIQGQIIDAETQESLPFATITYLGTTSGTVSNAQGYFQLQQTPHQSDTLLISYIGYDSKKIAIEELEMGSTVTLVPSVVQLNELIVYAMTPEEHLRKAIRKYSENFAKEPFTTTAYYREYFIENDEFLSLNEGVFFSSYPNYQDTIANRHQLALYRAVSDKDRIDFMRSWVEKKEAKDKKKALKKGEEWDEKEETRDLIRVAFGGPEELLKMDLMKETELCLDTTKFKKFRYQYGNGLTYEGRELIEILFESKSTVDHQRMQGVIHIDIENDAIVNLSYSGELVIPVVARPILLAFGLSIKEPVFSKSIKYQYQQNRWYPDTFRWDVSMGIKKTYVFKSNEYSDFSGNQIFKVNDLNLGEEAHISEENLFDPSEDPTLQVHVIESLQWQKINTVPIENLKSE